MAAAKLELPVGGKRVPKGEGRGRNRRLTLWLSRAHADALERLADKQGITRTAVIECGIELYAQAHDQPLPPDYQAPE